MTTFPDTDLPLVVRTDFSDEAAWDGLRREIEAPTEEGATVQYVSDPVYADLSVDDLVSVAKRSPFQSALFIVDHTTITHPEHPLLVLDLTDDPGRTFRAIPHEIDSIATNFWLANMDFADFAECADADGLFRGFPSPGDAAPY